MHGINVKSEIKHLKKVLLHKPGNELLNLTPDTLGELLFDDIPFLRNARKEHDEFAKTLRDNGIEVVYLEDLVTQVLDKQPELRSKFLEQFIKEGGIHLEYYQKKIYEYLDKNFSSNKDLVLKTMEGVNLIELTNIDRKNSLIELVSDKTRMVIKPMPNLYFTRDPFATIDKGVSLNRMYSIARHRETIYGEYIFTYHPEYSSTTPYYSRYNPFHIEGGDILVLSEKVLAIGISQRTEPDAIDMLSKNIFGSDSQIETILAINIPNTRAFMHLDTVFTQIDYDKFTMFPGISKTRTLEVFEITQKGKDGVHVKKIDEEMNHILSHYLGHDVEVILCAGGDRIAAEREQWNDGSNTLCIAPGTVVVYDRNDITNVLLRKHGINAIEVPSAELARGRGGPRCMSMPLWRED